MKQEAQEAQAVFEGETLDLVVGAELEDERHQGPLLPCWGLDTGQGKPVPNERGHCNVAFGMSDMRFEQGLIMDRKLILPMPSIIWTLS